MKSFFEKNGYAIVNSILTEADLPQVELHLQTVTMDKAGSRELLMEEWCSALALALKQHPQLIALLPDDPIAVQCTLFKKTSDKNWLVPLHQDLSIPVKEQLDAKGFTGWSAKQEMLFVQPPASVLEQIVAVRLHIDDCHQEHGPLRVVAGTHQLGRIPEKDRLAIRDQKGEQDCLVDKGGAVVMRPLILHSSSKAQQANGRRVLHFLYAHKALLKEIPFQFSV